MTDRVVAAFVPLVDCAVLVAAREQGFAAAEGFELALVKEPSWASLRDHLNLRHVDCAHALAPLPVASSLGVGHVAVDCIVPFVLGRGGNAVTVSAALFEEMLSVAKSRRLDTPAATGRALATVARRRAVPLTFGMVFPFSSHNFDLRYWFAACGVHPDRDLRLVAIPPPLMVESLRAGHVDGFCVGEPWNSLAVAEGIGRIVVTKSQLFPRGAEKVLAAPPSLEGQPERLGPLLRALDSAAAWADDGAHHTALAALLARPEYLDAPAELIEATLRGQLRLGDDEFCDDPDFIYFHRQAANLPRTEESLWVYAQMVRWGQLEPSAANETRAARVFRGDLYRRYVAATAGSSTVPSFDDVEFAAHDVAGYLAKFSVATPFVGSRPRLE
jgi:NitT/TauT family transport system ATP-binding protein